ncbi:hypothetical protein BH10BAC5_BH10BAC5_00840 [soil metagenome]
MFNLLFAFIFSFTSAANSIITFIPTLGETLTSAEHKSLYCSTNTVALDGFEYKKQTDSTLVLEAETGSFVKAVSVSSDNLGNIYILDNGSNEIFKMNSSLLIVKKNGKQGWREGEFDSPTSIDATTSLDIFVTDGNNRRVQRFDRNLNFISYLATDLKTFKNEFQYKTPLASVVLNSNDIYILDGENNRIVVYKDGLNPVNSFGDYQSGKGKLFKPSKIIKDNSNNIYILDKGSNSVKRYDSFGTFFSELKIDTIISISVFEKNLYILTGDAIYCFDSEKNAYISRISLFDEVKKNLITDFYSLNNNRFIILYKNKLTLWKLS